MTASVGTGVGEEQGCALRGDAVGTGTGVQETAAVGTGTGVAVPTRLGTGLAAVGPVGRAVGVANGAEATGTGVPSRVEVADGPGVAAFCVGIPLVGTGLAECAALTCA